MSEPESAAYPMVSNRLLDMISGAEPQRLQDNALLMQHNQQQLGAADIEMVARAGQGLLGMSPEAAAAAYPGVIAGLRAQGYAKHAPDAYPGHDVTRQLVSLGIPADKQFEYGAGRTAASGAASGLGIGDSGAATPGAGGGGGTPSGPVMGPRGLGSATRGEAEGGPPAPGSPGAAVAQRTHDFWASKGFSEPQIAGIMAGGPGSESDFTPSVYGDNRSSYGLYQHHGPRLEGMRKHFGLTGDAMPTEQQQNEYAYWEITQGPYAHVGAALKQAQTPADAATIWTRDFGVPADKTEIGRRARGAGRYAGLYGGAGAPSGAPGVQVGGDAPAPPGGTPGTAAPAGPGGFAVALPPAVAAPPPPPGQRVSSNIGAIMQGIDQARTATPASAMPMMAGPGAGGPEAQPLRAPEPGWGTGTPGTYGYSGGSPTPGTVAPAPAPAPVPAAQPPAAPAQPAAPQVPLAPVLPLKPSGLTAQQEAAALNDLNAPGIKVADVNRITAHYQALAAQNRTYNETAAQHNYERTRAAAADVETRTQHAQTLANQAQQMQISQKHLDLAVDANRRANQELEEKAKAAGETFVPGTGIEAVHENTVQKYAAKIARGQQLTDDEQRLYDGAYYALQQMGGQTGVMTDPNNPGQQIPFQTTRRLAPSLPEPKGGALPAVISQPGAAKKEPATADQSKNAGYADRLQQALPVITDTSPAAMNRWQQLRGEVPLVGNSLVSPEFQMHMQAERNFITALLRRESGAAISPSEFDMARKQYIPQPGDSPQALALKEQNRQTVLAGIIRDAGPGYKPVKAEAVPTSPNSDRPPLSSFQK